MKASLAGALFLTIAWSAAAVPAQWRSSGPYASSISIRSIAVDPVTPQRIYAATKRIYRSDDAGAHWQPVFPGVFALGPATAIDPSDHDVVYVGTLYGLFKSTDAGATSALIAQLQVTKLLVAGGVVYASTLGGGPVMSRDGGATFRGVPGTYFFSAAFASDPRSPGIVYAATTMGLMKTTDGGLSWTTVFPDLAIYSVIVDRQGSVYAAGITITQSFSLLKSIDGGAHWTTIDQASLRDGRIPAFTVNPEDGTVYLALRENGIYRLLPDGTRVSIAPTEVVSMKPYVLAFGGADRRTLYTLTESGGILAMGSDSVWRTVNDGIIAEMTVIALAGDPTVGSVLYAGIAEGGMFKSTDGGASWQALNTLPVSPTINAIAIDPTNTAVLYAAAPYAGIIKSDDRGATWRLLASLQTMNMLFVAALALDPPGNIYAAGPPYMTGSLVERSSDGGMSWFHASAGLPGVGEVEVFTIALAADPAVHQTLYTNPPFAGVYQTVNGGTWIAVNDGIAEPISALAGSPGHPSTIYAAGKGVVFRSTTGTSWTGSRTGLPQATPIVSLAADRENVYAATSSRVYQSTDGGRSWQELTQAGLTGTVSTLMVASDHTLFAAGFGGVYRYLDSTPKHRSARH